MTPNLLVGHPKPWVVRTLTGEEYACLNHGIVLRSNWGLFDGNGKIVFSSESMSHSMATDLAEAINEARFRAKNSFNGLY